MLHVIGKSAWHALHGWSLTVAGNPKPRVSLCLPANHASCLQRFPFGLSRLILQYILYSKNEGEITPRFLLWENHAFKRAILPASTKNCPISIENRKKKY
jgi:hypothetical protein